MSDDKENPTNSDVYASLTADLDQVASDEKKQLEAQILQNKLSAEDKRRHEEAGKLREQQRRYREEQERLARAQAAAKEKPAAESKPADRTPVAARAPHAAITAAPQGGGGTVKGVFLGALAVAAVAAGLYFFLLADRTHALSALEQSGSAMLKGAEVHAQILVQTHNRDLAMGRTSGELGGARQSLERATAEIEALRTKQAELEEQLREAEQARDEALQGGDNGGRTTTTPRRTTPRTPSGPAAPNVDIFRTQ